jgi:hypothetical protein
MPRICAPAVPTTPLHGLRRDIAGWAARTKIGVSTVSDCAAWVGDGISREWRLPLPNSAVPIMAMPMAAPIRWGVISAPPTEPTWSLPSPDPADAGSFSLPDRVVLIGRPEPAGQPAR